jgi:hypothetical protein
MGGIKIGAAEDSSSRRRAVTTWLRSRCVVAAQQGNTDASAGGPAPRLAHWSTSSCTRSVTRPSR